MTKRRKILKRTLFGVGAVLLLGTAAWLALDWFGKQRSKAQADAYAQEIISMLDLAALPDFRSRLDKLRVFINDNSIHKVDDAFWANHGNPDVFASGVVAYAKGTAG
jgi:hypothetical protein